MCVTNHVSPQSAQCRESLEKPEGHGADASREEGEACEDEQNTHHLFNIGEARPETPQEAREGLHGESRQNEGNAEAEGIGRQQHGPA